MRVQDRFLFSPDPYNYQKWWLEFIDKKKVDLGKGDRNIIKGETYNVAFHMTIPKELAYDSCKV